MECSLSSWICRTVCVFRSFLNDKRLFPRSNSLQLTVGRSSLPDTVVMTRFVKGYCCHNKNCRRILLSWQDLLSDTVVMTRFAIGYCCHCKTCYRILLSWQDLLEDTVVMRELAGGYCCHDKTCWRKVKFQVEPWKLLQRMWEALDLHLFF